MPRSHCTEVWYLLYILLNNTYVLWQWEVITILQQEPSIWCMHVLYLNKQDLKHTSSVALAFSKDFCARPLRDINASFINLLWSHEWCILLLCKAFKPSTSLCQMKWVMAMPRDARHSYLIQTTHLLAVCFVLVFVLQPDKQMNYAHWVCIWLNFKLCNH